MGGTPQTIRAAHSGLAVQRGLFPRALPWADLKCPFRARTNDRCSRSCRLLPAACLILILACTASTADAAGDFTTEKTPIHRDAVTAPASGQARPAGSPGTTLIFLGLLLGGAIIVRRVVQQRSKTRHRRAKQETITLLNRQPVDRELSVRLLQVGPRVLVVGSSPQGLATLTQITDPEEIAQLTGQSPATVAANSSSLFANETSIAHPKSSRQVSSLPPALDRASSNRQMTTQAGG